MTTRGSTDLLKAIVTSLQQVAQRRFINEFTAIFILSDGQDTCGNNLDMIQTAMAKEGKKIKAEYQIHSFGYGSDHDEKVLSAMRNFQNGKFYYISNNDLVDECFIDCLSNLMTVIGKDVKIQVTLNHGATFTKTNGKNWKDFGESEKFIQLKALLSDENNNYLAYVKVPPLQQIGTLHLMSLLMTYQDKEKKLSFSEDLKLEVVEGDDLGEGNQEVEEAHQKVVSQEVVNNYQELRNKGKE